MAKFQTIVSVRTETGTTRTLQLKEFTVRIVIDMPGRKPVTKTLRLCEGLEALNDMDTGCNEGRLSLVSIDDAQVTLLRAACGN